MPRKHIVLAASAVAIAVLAGTPAFASDLKTYNSGTGPDRAEACKVAQKNARDTVMVVGGTVTKVDACGECRDSAKPGSQTRWKCFATAHYTGGY